MTPELLSDLPLFKGLDFRSVASMASVMKERTLQPGQLLFEQGDKAWSLYIIIRGEVQVELPTLLDSSGRVVATLGRGEIVGEMSLLDGARRSARCVAGDSGAMLAQLDRPEFDMIFKSGNTLAYRLIDVIARQLVRRLRQTTDRLRAELE